MNVPAFIKQVIVDKDGNPTDSMMFFLTLLTQQMQATLSDDGWVVPSQTTANINTIASPENANAKPSGTIWYDSTVNKWKGNQNGAVVTFMTS